MPTFYGPTSATPGRSDHAYHANFMYTSAGKRAHKMTHISAMRECRHAIRLCRQWEVHAQHARSHAQGAQHNTGRSFRTQFVRSRAAGARYVCDSVNLSRPIEQLGTKSTHQQAHVARHKGIGFKATAPRTAVHGALKQLSGNVRASTTANARANARALGHSLAHTVCFSSHCNMTVCGVFNAWPSAVVLCSRLVCEYLRL